ncbi:MAG: hypothetical protein ACYS1B_15880, partial [Planctomycetota bacterium]
EYDLVVVVDTGAWTQLGPIADWLRDQIAYENAESLIEQIHRDIARVKRESGTSTRRVGAGVAGL